MTGTAKAAYRFIPELLTYVSYARGYKAGGFETTAGADVDWFATTSSSTAA